MKSLVVGGCGFIGSHICDALVGKGDEVIVYDTFHDPKCEYAFGSPDNENEIDWLEILVEECDRVYNFAGVLGTSSSFDYVPAITRANINFAVDIMMRCIKYDTALVSVGVPPVMWLNPYSISKACMVEYSKMFYMYEGLRGLTLIPYNIYGERQVHTVTQKLVPTVISSILNQVPIPVYGNGEQEIDMLYVKDFAKYVASLDVDRLSGNILDVGTGESMTVMEIVKTICQKMDVETVMEMLPTRKGEGEKVRVVSPCGINMALTSFSEGLDNTIEWYRRFEETYKGVDTLNNRVSILC